MFEQIFKKLFLFFVVIVLILSETLLHILIRSELFAFTIDHFKGEVSQNPEQFGLTC